jgi:hypothetical protein
MFLVDTLSVTLIVTSGLITCFIDTISTGVISLAVNCNSQFGLEGDGGKAGVRMDYFYDPSECDTIDSIVGNTEVYLYDGSLVFGNIVDGDTILSNTIYSQGPLNENSIYALEEAEVSNDGEVFNYYRLPLLCNADTTIGASVTYFTPQVTDTFGSGPGKTWYADQQFITKEYKIWSIDGLIHEKMAIGEVIDWDIPADLKDTGGTKADNVGEVNIDLNLMYSAGAEYNIDTLPGHECQDNNLRYGGMAFGYSKRYSADSGKWMVLDTVPFGGYFEDNARYVDNGWNDEELYANMESSEGSLIPFSYPITPPWYPDLHSVMTYAFNYDLLPNDTLVFYSVLATVRNEEEESPDPNKLRIEELVEKGRNFVRYFGCCHGLRGDLNSDGTPANILDLNYAVNRIFRGGPMAVCLGEADVYLDNAPLNILDLNFLVNYIFKHPIRHSRFELCSELYLPKWPGTIQMQRCTRLNLRTS